MELIEPTLIISLYMNDLKYLSLFPDKGKYQYDR